MVDLTRVAFGEALPEEEEQPIVAPQAEAEMTLADYYAEQRKLLRENEARAATVSSDSRELFGERRLPEFLGGKRIDYYIPPEVRQGTGALLAGVDMLNPLSAYREYLKDVREGDVIGGVTNLAGFVAPGVASAAASRLARPAASAVSPYSDDAARMLMEVLSPTGSPEPARSSMDMSRRQFLVGAGAAAATAKMPVEEVLEGLGRAGSRSGGRIGSALSQLKDLRSGIDSVFKEMRSLDPNALSHTLEREIADLERGYFSAPLNIDDTDAFMLRPDKDEIARMVRERRAEISRIHDSLFEPGVRLSDLRGSYSEARDNLFGSIVVEPEEYIRELDELSDDELRTLSSELSQYFSRFENVGNLTRTGYEPSEIVSSFERLGSALKDEVVRRDIGGDALDDAEYFLKEALPNISYMYRLQPQPKAFADGGVVSRGRNMPRERGIEEQTEEAFAAEKPRLNRMTAPLGANPDRDQTFGFDELGNRIYVSPTGVRYTIQTVTPSPREWETEPATWARMGEIAKVYATGAVEGIINAPSEIWSSMERLSGQSDEPATYGDLFNVAGVPATGAIPGIARGAVQGVEQNVLYTGAGAAGKPKRPAVPRFEQEAIGSSETRFRSPVESVIEQLEYPRDGIKGSQFLKELKDNPDVRDSEVAGIGLDIDPQKRYTQQEIMDAVSGRLYDVTVQERKNYQRYQQQSTVGFRGPEKDYFELVVNATPRGDNPGFKAQSQHYNNETLVHTRATVSEDTVGEYIFVQELQSDLLQQGFEPAVKPKGYTVQEKIKIFNDNLKKMLDEYDAIYQEFFGAGYKKTDILEKWNKLDSKDKAALIDMSSVPTKSRTIELDEKMRSTFKDILGDSIFEKITNKDNFLEQMIFVFSVSEKRSFPKKQPARNVPPIAKTEEAVRLAIDALMAEGQKRNVSRIVIPPLEKIAEARADSLAYVYGQKLKRTVTKDEAIQMALDPKSGFYDTYVRSVDKVLDRYKKEFGDDFVVRKTELPYPLRPINGQIFERAYRDNILHDMYPFDDILLLSVTDIFETVAQRLESNKQGYTFTTDKNYKEFISYMEKALPTFKYDSSMTKDEFVIAANSAYADAIKNLRKTYGTEIDFSGLINKRYNLTRPRFAEGGMVTENMETQMNRLLQEGGIADDGMRRDPISGNEIPPGSMATEVRDDIPAQLSEGEYVVPADVLRYYGVAFFEKLRAKAKEGLAEMEAGGRIGGERVEVEDEMEDMDELPFDISELQTTDDTDMQMAAMGMYRGGVVKMQEGGDMQPPVATGFNPQDWATPGSSYFRETTSLPQTEYRVYQNAQGQILSIPFIDGKPQQPIPDGYFPQGETPVTPTTPSTREREGGYGADREADKSGENRADSWASENYDAFTKDPIGFFGQGRNRAERAVLGAIPGATALADVDRIRQMEGVRANMSDDDPNKERLGEMIKNETENLSLMGRMLNGIVPRGMYDNAVANAGQAGGTGGGAGGAPATAGAGRTGGPGLGSGTAATSGGGYGRGTGATATSGTSAGVSSRGVNAPEGPEAGTAERGTDAGRGSSPEGFSSFDPNYGFMNKGGLAARPAKQKKTAQKRKIKTTEA